MKSKICNGFPDEFSFRISETFFFGSIIHNWSKSELSFKNFEIFPFEIFSAISAGFPELVISALMISSSLSTIDFLIVAFGKGTDSNIDTVRNQLIEVVEETLDNDITRNGNALDTQIVEASTDEGTIFPYGGVRITARVIYEFTRGSA